MDTIIDSFNILKEEKTIKIDPSSWKYKNLKKLFDLLKEEEEKKGNPSPKISENIFQIVRENIPVVDRSFYYIFETTTYRCVKNTTYAEVWKHAEDNGFEKTYSFHHGAFIIVENILKGKLYEGTDITVFVLQKRNSDVFHKISAHRNSLGDKSGIVGQITIDYSEIIFDQRVEEISGFCF